MLRHLSFVVLAGVAFAGCRGEVWEPVPNDQRGCDPLVPTYCAFPYPNDWWTRADPSTPTGRRLHLTDAIMPVNNDGVATEPEPFNVADGFSPAIAAMAHLPGATGTGLPGPHNIEASLAADSPTVILDAVSGRRVAHWAELDWYAIEGQRLGRFDVGRDEADLLAEQTLLIRPAVRPEDATRYIVAIRGVVDADGNLLPPTPAFQALRDGTRTEDPAIESRRGHFEDIFRKLEAAGVLRKDLQLAWDYTTASRENNTRWMVHVRDDALSKYPEGVPYTIREVTRDVDEARTACRLEITFDMPLYTTHGNGGAVLNFGEDGLPEQKGTFQYHAAMIVPLSAREQPASLVQYGHGQLGAKEEVIWGWQEIANRNNMAMFALDWKGFNFEEELVLAGILLKGDYAEFRTIPERLHQGILNFLMSMRTLSVEAKPGADTTLNRVLAEGCGGASIDPDRRYYFGGSQGGILGATVMALSTDIERGVLAVPGQPYNLLLTRSVNFDVFSKVAFQPFWWKSPDVQMILALIQGLWDRADPTGYSKYIRTDTLPNTPSHEVLLQVSVGDHQVTDLGAHLMARAIGGVVSLGPAYRPIWGIEEVTGEHVGSGILEIFFGNTETPNANIPPWEDPVRDPHNRGRGVDALFRIVERFLDEGVLENLCDGVCDPG